MHTFTTGTWLEYLNLWPSAVKLLLKACVSPIQWPKYANSSVTP